MKTKEKKIVLEWTGYADAAEVRDYMDNFNSDAEDNESNTITMRDAERMINEDSGYWEMQWDSFCEDLTDSMSKNEYWQDNATGMGWQARTGYKVFKATEGGEFLRAISPNTDCQYTITPHYKGFKVRIGHHDAPMGERHIIKPISAEQYEKLS